MSPPVVRTVARVVAVDQLLAHLKNTAINKLDELKAKLRELELAEAEKYQPQALVRTKENIENITNKITKDRDYKQAIILCGTAITEAENGIVETKATKCQAELRYLESKLAEARADEAILYAPDRLQRAEVAFQDLMMRYVQKQYDTVLNTIPQLKPQFEELVTVTRIEATKANELLAADRDFAISQALARAAAEKAKADLALELAKAQLYADNPAYLTLQTALANASAFKPTDKIIFTPAGTTPTIIVPGPGVVPTVNTTGAQPAQ